jgi:hypothetical protein
MARGSSPDDLEMGRGGAGPVVLPTSWTKMGSFGHPRPYLAHVPAAGG